MKLLIKMNHVSDSQLLFAVSLSLCGAETVRKTVVHRRNLVVALPEVYKGQLMLCLYELWALDYSNSDNFKCLLKSKSIWDTLESGQATGL